MAKIFKYPIVGNARNNEIEMPAGAEILSVGQQNGDLYLWAIVNPQKDLVVRSIAVVLTGETYAPAEGPFKFIGTVQIPNRIIGEYVVHVFEGIRQ